MFASFVLVSAQSSEISIRVNIQVNTVSRKNRTLDADPSDANKQCTYASKQGRVENECGSRKNGSICPTSVRNNDFRNGLYLP